jgi:hypothetical protein
VRAGGGAVVLTADAVPSREDPSRQSGRWNCGAMARDVCLLLLMGGRRTHQGDVRQPRMGCDVAPLALGGAMKADWGGFGGSSWLG